MRPAIASSAFRKDINGLRAWAVIAVLLFHFGIPGFGAGFVGVDIFFVISGYLMTGIILRGLEQGDFSLRQFYLARARRIVPALMLLIVVLLALGWFWLPTPDYKGLGRESTYALGFISNAFYVRTAGYFDSAAHEKWLLHTWSLGIEMQFYLLYPVLALVLWKIKSGVRTFAWSLVSLFALSLGWSLYISALKPVEAFYLLPTRGWELAAGGLLFLLERKAPRWLVGKGFWVYSAGLLFWLIGFVLIDAGLVWPSGWALLPVLGTALIILANQATSQPIWLVNPLTQWLGNISYSLYLWHWPLVVALYFVGLHNNLGWITAGLLLSLLLGQLSYRFVENPVRKGLARVNYKPQLLLLGFVALGVGLSAKAVRSLSFEGRLPALVELASGEVTNRDPRTKECFSAAKTTSPGCIYGAEQIGAVLMGDSHSASVVTALGKVALENEMGVLFWGKDSCPTLDNIEYTKGDNKQNCKQLNEWAFTQLDEYPNAPLILVSRTSTYLMGPNEPGRASEIEGITVHFGQSFESRFDPAYVKEFQKAVTGTACRLAQKRPVFLVRPTPEFGESVSRTLLRNYYRGVTEDIRLPLSEYHQRNHYVWEAQDAAAEQCGVKILDPLPYLCDEEYCYGSRNGRPLYFDDDHLSEYGNTFLLPMFKQVFADLK